MIYDYITDKGMREHNEDSYTFASGPLGDIFVVADGLGGYGGGDVASAFVANHFAEKFKVFNGVSAESFFLSEVRSTQSAIHEIQRVSRHPDMRSTIAAAIVTPPSAHSNVPEITLCHTGDTRIYVFSKFGILHMTKDHSVPQMLADIGEIKEKSIRSHPDRSTLLSAFGDESAEVKFELTTINAKQCSSATAILLCSDGFWEHVNESVMKKTLHKSKTPRQWLDNMQQYLNPREKLNDNYTAVAVFLKQSRH